MCDHNPCDLTRRRFLTRLALAGAGLAAAPLLMPTPAEAGFSLVSMPSVNDQKKAGNDAAKEVLKQYKEVHDSRAAMFQDMGAKLVAALPEKDRTTWDYKFHVIESKEVNAFALPGGNMFMFTGLYDKVTTEDALAAVTGHEMTHVRLQHWAKAYKQEQEKQLWLTGALLIFKGGGQYGQTVAGLYDSLTGLKYSRGEEDQADAGGLQDMVDAGYNPQGMIQLFEVLQKLSGNGGVSFLSDHPLTSDRITHAKARIAAFGNRQFPPLRPLTHPVDSSAKDKEPQKGK